MSSRRLDWDQIDGPEVVAVDAEVVDLAKVVAPEDLRVRVMCVAAAGREVHAAFAVTARLGLRHRTGRVQNRQHAARPTI